ncbi:hypothetical protein GKZ67_00865 [Hymenobacter sp. BRD67]|nr:hypothetical protein GKZ67_00865 [Hymenobacter sp. BRD67]
MAEALPETVDSGVVDLLDNVYQTGETYYGYELPLLIAQPEGPPKQMYFTFTYQAYRENGEIVGISTFAYDVARRCWPARSARRNASSSTPCSGKPPPLSAFSAAMTWCLSW